MARPYQLEIINNQLSLISPHQINFKPFSIDFADYLKHANLGQGGRRLLYKAVKIKNSDTILDATGGWARDAVYLAQQGLKVKLIEQTDVVFRLLEDAYQRALADPDIAPIIARIELIHADACALLRKGLRHKIIYLDPMFPERSKSAKVKKDLQILQSLPETHQGNPEELFLLAREHAEERVVVKRPITAPFLAEARPDFQYKGKTVRFDVYV